MKRITDHQEARVTVDELLDQIIAESSDTMEMWRRKQIGGGVEAITFPPPGYGDGTGTIERR